MLIDAKLYFVLGFYFCNVASLRIQKISKIIHRWKANDLGVNFMYDLFVAVATIKKYFTFSKLYIILVIYFYEFGNLFTCKIVIIMHR